MKNEIHEQLLSGFDCFYSLQIDVIELQNSTNTMWFSSISANSRLWICAIVLDFQFERNLGKKRCYCRKSPWVIHTEQKANFRFQQQ